MAKSTHSLLGGGKVYISLADDSDAMRFLGECPKVDLAFDEDKKQLKNYSTPGGGNADSVTLISSVTLTLTNHAFDSKALAIATYGADAAITGAAVTDEEHTVYLGGLVRADEGISMSAVTVVSKEGTNAATWTATTAYGGTSEPLYVIPSTPNSYYYEATSAGTSDATEPVTWPTTKGDTVVDATATWTCKGLIELVVNTDYEVNAGGVEILSTATNADDGDVVLFSYTHADSMTVDGILNTGSEYSISFVGFNTANNDSPVVLDVFKVKSSPASVSFIADDFATQELVFEVLKDDSKTGDGVSKYFKITQVEGQ